jgi:hypothetical protein
LERAKSLLKPDVQLSVRFDRFGDASHGSQSNGKQEKGSSHVESGRNIELVRADSL